MAFDRLRTPIETDAGSILLICDDAEARSEFAGLFQSHGYRLLQMEPAGVAMPTASVGYDLVIYDERRSPGRAMNFCRTSAVNGGAPIIVLSEQHDPLSQIVALEVGADEVVATPVDNRLLLARVRAMLRRTRRSSASSQTTAGQWALDSVTRRAVAPSGRGVELARHQVRLMQLFLDNPGVVVTPESLAALDPELRMQSAAFRTAISRLRRRLELTGSSDFLRVVRGSGYLHQPPLN